MQWLRQVVKAAGHFQVTKVLRQVIRCKCQRSKGARSFRGQKIIKPGHRMRFFPQEVMTTFLVSNTYSKIVYK